MTHNEHSAWLYSDLNACWYAVEYAARFDDPQEAWDKCENALWMEWLLQKTKSEEEMLFLSAQIARLLLAYTGDDREIAEAAIATAEQVVAPSHVSSSAIDAWVETFRLREFDNDDPAAWACYAAYLCYVSYLSATPLRIIRVIDVAYRVLGGTASPLIRALIRRLYPTVPYPPAEEVAA